MLRPERMSRVSVTGSKAVIEDVIDVLHDLRLLHVTEYDGGWDGFAPGDPAAGADEASEQLVTVRSLESILGVTGEEANGTTLDIDDDEFEAELEEVRTEVNDLDDERDELRDELRSVEERIAAVEPFAALGIDLDLLSGYDTLSVAVGEGSEETVHRALVDAEVPHEIRTAEGGVLAVFARTDDLDDVLVGTEFQPVEIPDAEGSPEQYLSELEGEHRSLEQRLTTVEDQLESLRLEVGGFLLAAEETLAIAVQQQEAPLSFATTENAFVAEGWLPTEQFVDLAEALQSSVGEHVEIDELERASYDSHGAVTGHEEVPGGAPTAADGGEEVRADGGGANVPMRANDNPPVIQDNPGPVAFFESLVQVINRPKYTELDPTIVLFLTFPFFFGLMIGDVGYGLLYLGIGYAIYQSDMSDTVRALGGIGMLAGAFTVLFGFLYGEIFGLELIARFVWHDALGLSGPPLRKGLRPAFGDYAFLWLVLSLVFGLLHLTVGYVFGFIEALAEHDLVHAVTEKGSWILMMAGIWAFVFSTAAIDYKPEFLVGSHGVFNGHPWALGFGGFPPIVGFVGVAVFVVGLAMLLYAEPVEGVEFLNVLVNVLSYTRIAAVLLAKAGMAFVVNLLVFGAYVEETSHGAEWLFITTHGGLGALHGEEIIFPGLFNLEGGVSLALGIIFGIIILVVGHALVLVLGITSAGLQAVRLEYVEFFSKFYEGGGDEYEPFGYERRYTTDD